jgi:hypothetical protein
VDLFLQLLPKLRPLIRGRRSDHFTFANEIGRRNRFVTAFEEFQKTKAEEISACVFVGADGADIDSERECG